MNKMIFAVIISAVVIGAGYFLFKDKILGNNYQVPDKTASTSSPSPTPESESPSPTESPVEEAAQSVLIENFSFNPPVVTIKKGTAVVWTNKDFTAHTVKSLKINSEALFREDTFKYTFNEKGVFDYICGLHPSMKGKVVVEE